MSEGTNIEEFLVHGASLLLKGCVPVHTVLSMGVHVPSSLHVGPW